MSWAVRHISGSISSVIAKETYRVPTHLVGRTAHKVESASGAHVQ